MGIDYSIDAFTRLFPLTHYWNDVYTEENRVKNTFGKKIEILNLKKILEIGPSVGITTKEIGSLFPQSEIHAIDCNYEVAVIAQKTFPQGVILYGDGFTPNKYYPSNSFDAVFMMNNFSYVADRMKRNELELVLFNIKSVLKNDGYLFIGNGIEKMKQYSHAIVQISKKSKIISFNDDNGLQGIHRIIMALEAEFDIDQRL